jgi:hypothetical protein
MMRGHADRELQVGGGNEAEWTGLNRVQRDMRHFQFVFSFGDVINISGDAG